MSLRTSLAARLVVTLLIMLGVGSTGCSSSPDRPLATNTEMPVEQVAIVEQPVPVTNATAIDATLANLDDLQTHIAKFAGQHVVVDIWSTACAPCMREFPHLVELSQRYAGRVACISLNVDYIGLKSKPPESLVPRVLEFLQKQNAVMTNLVSSIPDEEVMTKFDVESIPAILIFDTRGQLIAKYTDANSGDDGLTYQGDVIPKLAELLSVK